MNFHDLHELLRQELLRRIEAGALTGSTLARQAGFQQGHISNFLNRKRGLSLEGLDKVLAAQHLSLEQILPLSLGAVGSEPVRIADSVPLVAAAVAMDIAVIPSEDVVESIPFPFPRLEMGRSRSARSREHWQRFVAVRAQPQDAEAMAPVVTEGAILVLDRHYTSLAPFRPRRRNLYAVRTDAALSIRYVEPDRRGLLLRPASERCALQFLPLSPEQTPAEHLVGRVCLILSEV